MYPRKALVRIALIGRGEAVLSGKRRRLRGLVEGAVCLSVKEIAVIFKGPRTVCIVEVRERGNVEAADRIYGCSPVGSVRNGNGDVVDRILCRYPKQQRSADTSVIAV